MSRASKFASLTLAPLLMLFCISTAFAQLKETQQNCDMSLAANKKYLEQHRHPDGIIKGQPGCPGFDDVDPGYGNFWLNGVDLRIPRQYLFSNIDEADGAVDTVFLIFSVPYFEPLSTMAPKQISETATFMIAVPNYYCAGGNCNSFIEMDFFGHITGIDFLSQPENAVKQAQKILSLVDRIPERNGYYLLEGEGFKAAFQERDDEIVQWYYCYEVKPRCHSLHLFERKILIRLSLRHAHLRRMMKFKKLFYTNLLDQIVVGGID